ncbi:hypothetical protein [Sphingomonas sp. OTU376]|uniref:hypothetical protein n=1 Tax=Sphingomonas sp. OTU376 TaxID=3043863 RepID=UPI00313CD413
MAAIVRARSQQSVADQLAEMVALNELSVRRPLTHEESERLGLLIYREQQRARYRPALIAKLRAELAFLESLEIAERGAAAEGSAKAEPVDLEPSDDGIWSTSERQAA